MNWENILSEWILEAELIGDKERAKEMRHILFWLYKDLQYPTTVHNIFN